MTLLQEAVHEETLDIGLILARLEEESLMPQTLAVKALATETILLKYALLLMKDPAVFIHICQEILCESQGHHWREEDKKGDRVHFVCPACGATLSFGLNKTSLQESFEILDELDEKFA
jgi:hypothetical protein